MFGSLKWTDATMFFCQTQNLRCMERKAVPAAAQLLPIAVGGHQSLGFILIDKASET